MLHVTMSDTGCFRHSILHCERLKLVCSYDSCSVLPEMSIRLAEGLCGNKEKVTNILNYIKEKHEDILDCDLIQGILITYKQRPIVFVSNNNYKEQIDSTLFHHEIIHNTSYSRL